jgi:hypothetical protein
MASSKHAPTTDVYRGLTLGLQKVQCLLDDMPSPRYHEGDLLEWYVIARTAGWQCDAFMPTGDRWEHALLTKNGNIAQIDVPGGTLVVYRRDRSLVHEPIPYKHADYRTPNPRSRR